MNDIYLVIAGFILYFSCAVLVAAFVGQKRNLGFDQTLMMGIVFSPIVSLLMALVSGKRAGAP